MAPRDFSHRLVYALLAVALIAGSYARIAHLDRKLFWQDEAFAALMISGHNVAQLEALYDGRPRPVAAVRALITRDPATSVLSVVSGLAQNDPQHPPFFYVLDRLSIDALGSSPAGYRALSVLIGLLTIGMAFLFGQKLLGSSFGGVVLCALVAVSPLHVIYSRQTREYELLALETLLASWLLLRALEAPSALAWIGYAVAVGASLYTDPIFLFVIAAHAVTALVARRDNLRALVPYAVATLVGAATYVPWALQEFGSRHAIRGELAWGARVYPLKFLAEKWGFNIGAVFFDAEFADLRWAVVAAAAIVVAGISLVVVARGRNRRLQALSFSLIAIVMGAFVVRDMIGGSFYATIPRYLMPGWIGLEIAVAAAIATGLQAQNRFALAAFAFLICAGTGSVLVDNGAENWWDNNSQVAFQTVAMKINAYPDAVVALDANPEVPLMLATYLHDDVALVLVRDPKTDAFPIDGRPNFLVVPSPELFDGANAHGKDRYILENISPPRTTIITGFHSDLARSGVTPALRLGLIERPDNALWYLRPAR